MSEKMSEKMSEISQKNIRKMSEKCQKLSKKFQNNVRKMLLKCLKNTPVCVQVYAGVHGCAWMLVCVYAG